MELKEDIAATKSDTQQHGKFIIIIRNSEFKLMQSKLDANFDIKIEKLGQ